MIKYKRVDTANGRIMYFKNGKMISGDDVPTSIKLNLEDGAVFTVDSPVETVDETTSSEGQLAQDKTCVFCGEPSDTAKFVNGQTVLLCSKDYASHTTGEIVAFLRDN